MQLSKFTERVPASVSEEIEQFCEAVAAGQKPVLVPVVPQAEAVVNRCHVNVADHVKRHGGAPAFGWIVWQSDVLLHAEFHCNWSDPSGALIDITPKADGEKAVLFLPDPNTRWAGRLVPSRRTARLKNPLIERFIRA